MYSKLNVGKNIMAMEINKGIGKGKVEIIDILFMK